MVISKRKISNLNDFEMGIQKGGTSGDPCMSSICWTVLTCEDACYGTGYLCISVTLTMPCETYPKC